MNTENKIDLVVENVKCGGCSETIVSALTKIHGVTACEVDVKSGTVTVEGHPNRLEIVRALESLGFPETGTENTLLMKAKSFVTSAVNRIRNRGHE